MKLDNKEKNKAQKLMPESQGAVYEEPNKKVKSSSKIKGFLKGTVAVIIGIVWGINCRCNSRRGKDFFYRIWKG